MSSSTETTNILRLADFVDSNQYLTPEDVLERALEDFRDTPPHERYKKIIVMTLLDDDSGYQAGYYAGNIKGSEMIALMETIKHKLVAQLAGMDE